MGVECKNCAILTSIRKNFLFLFTSLRSVILNATLDSQVASCLGCCVPES